MGSLPEARIRRVAIVGGGPAGIAAAKYLLAEDYFETIHVFEQQANFGGVWNYSNDAPGRIDIPQTNPNQPLEEPIWHSNVPGNSATHSSPQATFVSPIYERLETNIPHCIMKFSDMPSLEMNQLFPSREAVTQYLENYAEGVKHLVKFQTQVTDIRRTLLRRPYDWLVQTKDLRTSIISDRFYSAIVVANGHYTVPSLPNIRGIKDWDQANKGVISHSKSYRRPEPFANKKVLIVGNSASGTDIASQIAKLSKHPMLISQRSESPMAFAASYKENVPEIAEFLAPAQGRAVRFVDGRVERNIDAILFATGYYYSFPFLSSLEPKLISTGERVQHLYKHMFYIDDPTIAFIGLPSKIIPFRTFESQAAVIARIWSDRLELPSRVEMRKWEEVVIAERGTGKPFHMLPFPKDIEYHNSLVHWAMSARGVGRGKTPPKWSEKETWTRERFPEIKKAFADRGEARHSVRRVEELGFDYDASLREQKHIIP